MKDTREDFQYARLYHPVTGAYCSDGSIPDAVMGPETRRRYEENTDACAVTVCCITYNHEDYIRQTLDGFVNQKTDFRFQVFVGEDHGTDGTADIIREYADRYPDLIVPFLREQNMGAQTNLIDLCQTAHSPYIAFCEGDDYWIDEHKLQTQFDYMQTHPDIRMCYMQTEILAPEDWHLNSYYRHEPDGRMIIPGCTPNFKEKEFYTAADFVTVFPNHTSTAFYRWNYDLDIPDWYFEGLIGDTPITILQMGQGKAVYVPGVASVYRRSDVGVFMNGSDQEHFANTRLDYIRLLSGLRHYFNTHFGMELDSLFRWRITQEIVNYLKSAETEYNAEMVQELAARYPAEMFEALHTFMGIYGIYSSFQRKLSAKDLQTLTGTRTGVIATVPVLKVFGVVNDAKNWIIKAGRRGMLLLRSWKRFWANSKVEKQTNLWVFAGFRHFNYMDNAMYFYEYLVEHHPEIEAVWVTTSRAIHSDLAAQGKPVLYMNSAEGRETIARAAVAVTDHFVMSDFPALHGFNAGTKVVQLWHGVGFKSMGDKDGVRNTTEPGVRYSNDILAAEGDSALVRWVKRARYRLLAPFRERFEEYFLMVCPGQERLDMIADVWHVPRENCFMAGHPRDLPVYSAVRQETPIRVMYAPTYRFDFQREALMVQEFLDQIPAIEKLMEEIDGEFSLRMHPHTWRNYKGKILRAIQGFDRIVLNEEKDIYQTLGTCSIVISDYSSIALDFALLDRPVIFHGADYEWFQENEAGFNLDFPSVIPGPLTADWNETLQKTREYAADLTKDSELRQEKLQYFFDRDANGPDNSERITAEIKRRLGMK